ncbi:MAG: MarR family transcriptional regulator [Burkholderiales bacterium RIFCSPLOWO2_02_FULL_57_36]|nr:MAG: MarR family transcriptional regulator [Burkholderiales bacterium RIFCSPLOWO2_02_FULL_57_36]
MKTVAVDLGDKPAPLAYLDTLKNFRVVIRAAQRHSAWVEKQCGVSGAQLWVMQELHDHSGLRVGDIAKKLAIHQTTASNLLDSLEKRGYVVKTRDREDQRVVKLALSDQGAELLLRAPAPARGLLPEALQKLDTESLAKLNDGLKALLECIDGEDAGHGLQPLPFTL